MHIAIYTDDPDKGGVAQYNHSLLSALAAKGHIVTSIQPQSTGALVQLQQSAGIRHEWIGFDPGKDFNRTIVDTADAQIIFHRLKPDLVVFSDCCPISNIAAKEVALARGIPIIIVVNFAAKYLAERFPSCLGVIGKQHARARQVVAVSQENLELLRRYFRTPVGKSRLIHYGRPERFFAPIVPSNSKAQRTLLGLTTDDIVCLSAARMTHVKGFQYIIAAAELLKSRADFTNLHFVWAGDGDLKTNLEEKIESLGLSNHFHLLGHRDDVCELLEMADMFLLPSHFEGMPLAIMESMARRVPVVATEVSGIPEELGEGGILLPNPELDATKTTRALADAILHLARNPSARHEIGRLGNARAISCFREAIMLQKTVSLIESQFISPAQS